MKIFAKEMKVDSPLSQWDRGIGLVYFEYALALPEEHYLIKVQTRTPGGEVRGQAEIEGIAKECLALVIGKGHDDQVKDL